MNKIDAYKKIDSLNKEILKYKKAHGLLTSGDIVYYSPNVISKRIEITVHSINEVIVENDDVNFLISDDVSEGCVGLNQIFRCKKDAVADYNQKLETKLKELIFDRLLSEKDRLDFILLQQSFAFEEIFMDKEVRWIIVEEIINSDNDDKQNIFDNLYQKLKAK